MQNSLSSKSNDGEQRVSEQVAKFIAFFSEIMSSSSLWQKIHNGFEPLQTSNLTYNPKRGNRER